MNKPSRREFFTYAAAATLASGCKTDQTKTNEAKIGQTNPDQSKKDTTLLPLVVDVIGPMAFQWTGTKFELWMPDLSSNKRPPGITEHKAGIMTTVTSIELKDGGNYEICGPSNSSVSATTYTPPGAQVYQAQVKETSALNKRYIYMSLPMPSCIVVLDPVPATVYPTASPQQKTSGTFAVGVRLFYTQAGEPTLCCPNKQKRAIPFYASPCEKQTNMEIGYAPIDTRDPNHADSRKAFHEVSRLLGLDLQVAFDESQPMTQPTSALTMEPFTGRYHDCKSLVIGVGGS